MKRSCRICGEPADASLCTEHERQRQRIRTRARGDWTWVVTKRRVLERDGYACVQCGATAPLEVDHIVPLAGGGSNEMSNLRTLCRACHRRVT